MNFGRSHSIAASVQKNLQDSFEDKGEQRILDLFMNLPKEQENSYLTSHFEKLDKDFEKITKAYTKASKNMDMFTKSITQMESFGGTRTLD